MSDFICSSDEKSKGELAKHLKGIYSNQAPEVYEYHGPWGSLAVSKNQYNGFQPLETDSHIIVVIGGPVLNFKSNRFFNGNDPTAGTGEIYRNLMKGVLRWDEDLSGPFVVLLVDKKRKKFTCITDLMMFIPVYKYIHDDVFMLGTHIDSLAAAADQLLQYDYASVVDFILNHAVTYPYTFFRTISQCHPAAVHRFETRVKAIKETEPKIYWLPVENYNHPNIYQAAYSLRVGLQAYITRVTENMDSVAQFISAGEDSRAIAGVLPKQLHRHAFVFLNGMNREGRLAKKAAKAYGLHFHPHFRGETHYLDILPEANALIGSGHQYVHAHSLRFHRLCKLDQYDAVFGGYLSDSLLKAPYARKIRGQHLLPWLPHFVIQGETRSKLKNHSIFSSKLLDEIRQRRIDHLDRIKRFRAESAHEWFTLWPATMRSTIPNLYCNRRLFRSYEPFMCNQSVKISASVPTAWKLNRRLFHKTIKPFLAPSKWLASGDGRFPYAAWWLNFPIQFSYWLTWEVAKRIGLRTYQGPWGDWNLVMKSRQWHEVIKQCRQGFEPLRKQSNAENPEDILRGNQLNIEQKINFVQTLYSLSGR